MSDETSTEAAVIAELAVLAMDSNTIDGIEVATLPKGYTEVSLEKYRLTPQRKTGTATMRDAASFIQYVIQEADERSRIYGSYNPPKFMAVFNDHSKSGAGWRDHRATFDCPLSVEWKTWVTSTGKQMTQEQFAQFIEDNLPDIANPPAAEMLEISRSLEAKKKVNFASGIRLSNGQNELTYTEEIQGTANKGKINVPELFTIGIQVLEGGQRYAVESRLRYRISDGGKMAMWYELVRSHKILEDAVKEAWIDIQNKTGVGILNGSV